MLESFKAAFCEIGFVCNAGEPHWLGWSMLALTGSMVLGLVFVGILFRQDWLAD